MSYAVPWSGLVRMIGRPTVQFTAVRGKFSFGPNQHPIQDYYLTKFAKNGSGEIVQTIVEKVAQDYGDAYAARCKMD